MCWAVHVQHRLWRHPSAPAIPLCHILRSISHRLAARRRPSFRLPRWRLAPAWAARSSGRRRTSSSCRSENDGADAAVAAAAAAAGSQLAPLAFTDAAMVAASGTHVRCMAQRTQLPAARISCTASATLDTATAHHLMPPAGARHHQHRPLLAAAQLLGGRTVWLCVDAHLCWRGPGGSLVCGIVLEWGGGRLANDSAGCTPTMCCLLPSWAVEAGPALHAAALIVGLLRLLHTPLLPLPVSQGYGLQHCCSSSNETIPYRVLFFLATLPGALLCACFACCRACCGEFCWPLSSRSPLSKAECLASAAPPTAHPTACPTLSPLPCSRGLGQPRTCLAVCGGCLLG